MTIFGLLWSAAIVFCFCSRSIKNMTFLTLLAMIFQCDNFIDFGGFAVGSQLVTSILFIVRIAIFNSVSLHPRKEMRTIRCAFSVFLFICLISIFVNFDKIQNQDLLYFLHVSQIYIFFICSIAMSSVSRFFSESEVYRFVEIITIIQLAIGVLQYIISLGVIPRLFIINELLYNDHGEVTYYYSSFRRVLSTYQEPSFYACFLVGAFFFFLSSKVRNKKRTIIMVLSIIEIILTFSSTAYGALAIIGILYICLNATSRRGIFLAATGSVVALIMFIFFKPILNDVIFDKASSGSAAARRMWDYLSTLDFESSPIIGIGYKMSRASSLSMTVLASEGIIGFIGVICIILMILLPLLSREKRRIMGPVNISIRYACLAAFCCLFIAVPDIDISPLWLWLYILQLSVYRYKNCREA